MVHPPTPEPCNIPIHPINTKSDPEVQSRDIYQRYLIHRPNVCDPKYPSISILSELEVLWALSSWNIDPAQILEFVHHVPTILCSYPSLWMSWCVWKVGERVVPVDWGLGGPFPWKTWCLRRGKAWERWRLRSSGAWKKGCLRLRRVKAVCDRGSGVIWAGIRDRWKLGCLDFSMVSIMISYTCSPAKADILTRWGILMGFWMVLVFA